MKIYLKDEMTIGGQPAGPVSDRTPYRTWRLPDRWLTLPEAQILANHLEADLEVI